MNSTKQLEAIQEGINACKGELGFFNPQRMFDLMNVMQKKDDPQAYQPEIVKTIQLKQLRDTEEQQKREEKERLK